MKKLDTINMLECVGGGDIPGIAITLEVGLNSPKGSKFVTAPAAAETGALNAFTHVLGNGVQIDNIDVLVGPG